MAMGLLGSSFASIAVARVPLPSAAWCASSSAVPRADCNGNGVEDALDITSGTSSDCDLNGIPDECDLAADPSLDIDGDGQLDACVAPPLMADVYKISVATGGTQNFTLSTPFPFGLYLLLGTASGTSPGAPVGGFVLPLNVDAYLLHTLTSPGVFPLAASFGSLVPAGSSGVASASFRLPPAQGPGLVGLTLHHAYVTFNLLTGNLNFVSNPVPLALEL